MKNIIKGMIAASVCFVTALHSNPFMADEIFTEGLYEYRVEDNKATIVKYNGKGTEVKILCVAEELGGYPVVAIGDAAFYECIELENMILPDSVIRIGDSAFFHSGLRSIVIPASVETVEDIGFTHCHDLEKVYYLGDAPEFGEGFTIEAEWFTTYYMKDALG